MSNLELALLVLLAVIMCVMVFRDMKVKGQMDDMRLTISLQQKTIDELIKTDTAQESHLLAHDSALRRLDEQTGKIAKIAKRLFEHTNSKVSHGQAQLAATVERVQKAQFWRNRGEGVLGVHANETADKERPAEGLSP